MAHNIAKPKGKSFIANIKSSYAYLKAKPFDTICILAIYFITISLCKYFIMTNLNLDPTVIHNSLDKWLIHLYMLNCSRFILGYFIKRIIHAFINRKVFVLIRSRSGHKYFSHVYPNGYKERTFSLFNLGFTIEGLFCMVFAFSLNEFCIKGCVLKTLKVINSVQFDMLSGSKDYNRFEISEL